jgi:hypothetical protein
VKGGGGKLRQRDREQSLQPLMTVNLLKRLESSVHSFRLSLQRLKDNHLSTLAKIETFKKTGRDASVADLAPAFENAEPDDDELPSPDDEQIGGKVQISLAAMPFRNWSEVVRGWCDPA